MYIISLLSKFDPGLKKKKYPYREKIPRARPDPFPGSQIGLFPQIKEGTAA